MNGEEEGVCFEEEFCLTANDDEDLANLIILTALYNNMALTTCWIVDSAASNHFISCMDNLLNYRQITPVKKLTGSGIIWGIGRGDIKLDNLQGERELKGVIFVLDLKCNALLSVTQMMREGLRLIFQGEGCRMDKEIDGKWQEFLSGTLVGKTIYVDLSGRCGMRERKCKKTGSRERAWLHGSKDIQPLEVWHKRLGHINEQALIRLQNMLTGMEFGTPRQQTLNEDCNPCLKGAQHVTISRISLRRAKELLEVIWTDVKGPLSKSLIGFRYFVTFTNNKSRYTFSYPLQY